MGALLPLYPPVCLFYWFSPGPFALKLALVLTAGAAQLVFGIYLAIERVRQVRWHWLVLAVIIIVLLLLIYPALNYFFGL
jgi:hypothetical protein